MTDRDALARRLEREIEGEVRFDQGARALYANDASSYRHVPIGVVVPKTIDDVRRTVAICRDYGAPIVSRGGGTGLAGQTTNVAVVIDWSKYLHRIIAIDPERRRAVVEPGVVLDRLREEAEKYGLTFGPDPATHEYCTLGGMIGNNSCGTHSVAAGKTADNVESLKVLTYDGVELDLGSSAPVSGRGEEIHRRLHGLVEKYAPLIRERYPRIPRRVSGYNLDELLPENDFHVSRALVGSESTLVTVLEATVTLIPSEPRRAVVVAAFSDVVRAAEEVPEILTHGPIALEGLDEVLVRRLIEKGTHAQSVRLLPEGRAWLFIELGAREPGELRERAEALVRALPRANARAIFDPALQSDLWHMREAGLGATAFPKGEPPTWEGWEDAAVHPNDLAQYLRSFRELLARFGYRGALYGHFGDGCVHTRIDFDLATLEGARKYRLFLEAAGDLVVSLGGSLSGEHGDGQTRSILLEKVFGPELIGAFEEMKRIWDPEAGMSPGRIVNPVPPERDLMQRVAANAPKIVPRLALAPERCVGVGKCRRTDSGVMCPSYMVTREEMHSTRGRARMLFGMMAGDSIEHGFQDEQVKEALDLCLECKGCKSECPVNVDMASYKAEFLSRYYEGHRRPRSARTMGEIYRLSRLASLVPDLANLAGRLPIVKRLAGVAEQRALPSFSPLTLRAWWKSRGSLPPKPAAPRLVLWPDTFTNTLHPEIGIGAVESLERLGFEVVLPSVSLCCGRPLYSYGFLDRAKSHLERCAEALEPEIERGARIVFLEPSCASVMKDELLSLFPNDARMKLLSDRSLYFSDVVLEAIDRLPKRRRGRAILHRHCHHRSVLGSGKEEELLERLGLETEVLDSGCCGMAGAFGFEREHYEISMKIGERVLLPRVRRARADELIIADGFSCREQIAQAAGRRALHVAEVVRLAIAEPKGEARSTRALRRAVTKTRLREAAFLVALSAGVLSLARLSARRR
jgi:FAD/FMN-containing dehydrogenase/Fe-S oxidoreductase